MTSDPGMPQNATALSEFWDFAKDFQSVTAWVAKAAVAAPFMDLLLNLGPPWPSRAGVAILVCLVEVLVLMYAFEFWRRKQVGVRGVQRVMRWSLVAVVVTFPAYLWLFATYVRDAPDRWNRVVIGTTLKPPIAELVRFNSDLYTSTELLERFERNPANVWTEASVNAMRVLVLITWLAFWAALSVVVASFVALQWRRKSA